MKESIPHSIKGEKDESENDSSNSTIDKTNIESINEGNQSSEEPTNQIKQEGVNTGSGKEATPQKDGFQDFTGDIDKSRFEKLMGEFNINQTVNVNGETNIEFSLVIKRNYIDEIFSETEKEFIKGVINTTILEMKNSNFLIINHEPEKEVNALAIAEELVNGLGFKNDKRYLSCLIDVNIFTYDFLIRQLRILRLSLKKSNSSLPIILRIQEKNVEIGNVSEFLKSIMSSRGAYDSLKSILKELKILIVYVCNNRELYNNNLTKRSNINILNLSSIHFLLKSKLQDTKVYGLIIREVEIAISEYDWLTDFNVNEKLKKIELLIEENQLENFLEKIKEKDIEEKKVLTGLLKDPLNNIVLFVSTFFKDISVLEFDNVVKRVILSQENSLKNDHLSQGKDDLLSKWENEGDAVLTNCGIIKMQLGGKFSIYRLKNSVRAKIAIEIFNEKYSLRMLKLFEVIEKTILHSEKYISDAFLEGLVGLCFLNAQADTNRYLVSVCLNIVDLMDSPRINNKDGAMLYKRLLFIVKKWGENEEYKDSFYLFSQRLRENPIKREILGLILSNICDPLRKNNIDELKELLNSIGNDETDFNFSVVEKIAKNYLDSDDPDSLLLSIDQWGINEKPESISRSFAFAKCAILLSFYDKKFFKPVKKNDIGYQLLKHYSDSLNKGKMESFIRFVFSNRSKEAFNIAFKEIIKTTVSDDKSLQKSMTNNLFLMYSFILVQWYYLISVIKENQELSNEMSAIEIMTEIVNGIKAFWVDELELLEVGINRTIAKYNERIRNCDTSKQQEKELRKVLMIKRDLAREIYDLLLNPSLNN